MVFKNLCDLVLTKLASALEGLITGEECPYYKPKETSYRLVVHHGFLKY